MSKILQVKSKIFSYTSLIDCFYVSKLIGFDTCFYLPKFIQ